MKQDNVQNVYGVSEGFSYLLVKVWRDSRRCFHLNQHLISGILFQHTLNSQFSRFKWVIYLTKICSGIKVILIS